MQHFDSYGPNPRIVRMFFLEKGIPLETTEIDIFNGENRGKEYLERNPTGQIPSLELDNGTVIGETAAICEFIEELYPDKPLIGFSPEQRAKTRMWCRRVELQITEHMYHGFRYGEGYERFKEFMLCIPEASEGLKAKARERREWLEKLIKGRDFIAGDQLTLADLVLFCCWDFLKTLGQPVDEDLPNLSAWFNRIQERPTAKASLHPQSAAFGANG